nr:MAG TPA: hypothetical protein [Caudoviricetes sp.]
MMRAFPLCASIGPKTAFLHAADAPQANASHGA